MAVQGLFTGDVQIRSLNGYLIAVNGLVYATTNTGGTTVSFFYQAKTTITSGDPGSGYLIWNNATQTSATQLNISHLTDTPIQDIDLYLSAIAVGNKLIVQDRDVSERFQIWTVTGTPTQIASSYWTIPVTLTQSAGAAFTNNHKLLFAIVTNGSGGVTANSITFNNSGSGAASGTSFNGGAAQIISYNTIGAQAASGSLSSLAGLTYASASFVKMTGANTFTLDTNTYLTANQSITLSGDISGTGTTAITTAIGTNKVTNAMLAQIATARIRGRVTAGTGNVEDLTGTQATTLLDNFTSALKGLAPASGGGTTNFLRADGTWAAPSGGGGSPAGSNTQIQYNSSGAFGASANLTWDNSGQNLAIGSGTASAYLTILANNTSNGWAGRLLGDNPTGAMVFQHRNNSATFVNCWAINAGGGVGSTYIYDKGYVINGAGSAALMINTTDNGVDKLQVSGSAIASTFKFNTSGQTVTISSYYNTGAGRNIWIGGGGLSSTSGEENTAIGVDAMLNNTSGYYNVALGSRALKFINTGYSNVALGFTALENNTSGQRNVGIGTNALNSVVSATDNFGIGAFAMQFTTGSKNVGVGSQVLYENTTGASNIAFGLDAGRRISAGTANQTSNQSIFIGEDTRASVAGNTNEMVFGHTAIGQGSNTVTLGNSSITKTFLRGRVMINTTTDNSTDNLQVSGSTISTQYKLSALNTAPALATSTGTLGEIRIDASAIYICTATNTWKRALITTF